ncbi:MAG: hypothetical protein AAGA48_08110 [Myxococcota bacterium]
MIAWGLLLACTGPEISGTPSIEVGSGQFDFEAVKVGQEVPIVRGPQGGDHVWLGVRIRNLDPRRLRLDSQLFTAELPEDTGLAEEVKEETVGEPFFFFPPFFDDEAGDSIFRTAGLPHQVERSRVRGRRLRLEVLATDRDGRTATGDMIIVPIRVDDP